MSKAKAKATAILNANKHTEPGCIPMDEECTDRAMLESGLTLVG